jgi:hypothetical protein
MSVGIPEDAFARAVYGAEYDMITSGAAGGTSARREGITPTVRRERHSSQDFCTKALPRLQSTPFVRHKASKPPTQAAPRGGLIILITGFAVVLADFESFDSLDFPVGQGLAQQLCRVASIFKVQRRKSVQFAVERCPPSAAAALPPSARQGKARQGKARQGKARQGKARQGKARQGKARQGKARQGAF